MSEQTRVIRRDWAVGGTVFLLLLTRACAFGIQYWPQLDDYIQYHNYASKFDFATLAETVGILASRPLAGVADYFVWSPMFDHMIVGVALICGMYAVSVVLMLRLLSRYFALGPVFPVVMALLPLGVEGTYWMSAATRVVVGLLCACLAGWCFGWWLDRGGWYRGGLFAVAVILPFGFYEQSGVLAMTLVLGMGCLEIRHRRGRALLALWCLPAAGLYLKATTLLSAAGVYGSRAKLMLPGSDYYWNTFLPDILGQIKEVFTQGTFYTLVKGFVRGARLVLSGELVVWFFITATLCALYGWVAWRWGLPREQQRGRGSALTLLAGLLLAVAPVTPFLILENPWFSLRGAVSSFPGIALVCDRLILLLWERLPTKRAGPAVLSALTALVFCLAGASEIGDYRDTWYNDQQAGRAVLQALKEDFSTLKSTTGVRVGILGMEPSRLPNQNFYWHEHIHGCTESDWAFTGLLVFMNKEAALPSVTPLPSDPMYRAWNAQSNRVESFDALYYYDGQSIFPVLVEQTQEKEYAVCYEDGTYIGKIWEEKDSCGYFRLAEQLAG